MTKEKEKKKKRKKLMASIVIASRPSEPRPTGKPHARAKSCSLGIMLRAWPELEKGASGTLHVIQAEHFVGNPAVSKPLE